MSIIFTFYLLASESMNVTECGAVAKFLCLGGSAWPKKVFEPRSGEENCFGLLGGSEGMLPQKIFKIKSPRLAKNAFPEISARKN